MTTTQIIDACLKAIGDDTASPVLMSRTDVLALINHAYQDIVGESLNIQKSATLTVSAGVANLPSGFIRPVRTYDGTTLLTQIEDINEKVDDTDECSQYWIPNETEAHFFGTTPADTVTMYYKAKPTALTESPSTSPTSLKGQFHISLFAAYIKMILANRMDNLNDYFSLQAEFRDIVEDVKSAHAIGRRDKGQRKVKARSWW